MHVELVGLSHKTAPVELRERVVFSRRNLTESLPLLTAMDGVVEGMVLSTCNRTEIYASAANGCHPHQELKAFLAARHALDLPQLEPHLYALEDMEAVRHLYRVATGIDSMVVGETAVLGQLREAAQIAEEHGVLHGPLDRLMQDAVSVGKRARAETGISRGALSVASVAVDLARSIFGDLSASAVLVLGAGDTAELVVRHLVDSGARSVIVSNRTYHRAVQLAKRFQGEAVTFDDFPHRLAEADIIIASTASPHAVVQRETVAEAMRARRGRPLFLVDIAVPRDVAPDAGDLDSVFLYDIDDLEAVVAANTHERQREVERVERIIEEEAARFLSWLQQRSVTPTVVELKEHVEDITEQELGRLLGKFSSERDRELARRLARGIANKILAGPFKQLKRAAHARDGHQLVAAVRRLFRLELREK